MIKQTDEKEKRLLVFSLTAASALRTAVSIQKTLLRLSLKEISVSVPGL